MTSAASTGQSDGQQGPRLDGGSNWNPDDVRDALARHLTDVRAVGVRAIYAPRREDATWSLYLEEPRARLLVVAELLRIPGVGRAATSLPHEGGVLFEIDGMEAFTEWASERRSPP